MTHTNFLTELQNGIPSIHLIRTFESQDSPRSTSDAAHLWPPQYGLYRYYPPQRSVPGCFGNNASTMVESAHEENKTLRQTIDAFATTIRYNPHATI